MLVGRQPWPAPSPESPKDPMTEPLDPSTPADAVPQPDTAPVPQADVVPPPPASVWAPPAPPSASAPDGGVGFAVPPAPVSGAASTRPPASSGGYGKWLIAVLVPVIAIVTFAGGVAAGRSDFFGAEAGAVATAAPNTGDKSLDLIEEAWRTLHENYVDAKNLDNQGMAYGAIRGMTDAVGDEGHTSFLTADEAKAIDQSLSGTFVGIGVQVSDGDESGPVIRSVIPNTPAAESGTQARRQDRRRRRQEDRWPHDGRGRVARPRPGGRGRDAHPRP